MNAFKSPSPLYEDIRAQVGDLSKETIHWFNYGRYSLYDLIEYLLAITGKARLKVSSFNVSEAAVRRFIYLQNAGMISSLQFLFDHSTQKNKLSQLLFLGNFFEIRVTNNHTKIVLLENDRFHLVVSTSSNLNQNRKHEHGFVSKNSEVFALYSDYFDNLFANAIPFV